MTTTNDSDMDAIDIDAVHARYRVERDKRPRPDGKGVERVASKGVVVGGTEYELDAGYYNNAGCYHNEGQGSGRRGPLNSLGYLDGPVAYFDYIDRWRQTGDFAELEFRAR